MGSLLASWLVRGYLVVLVSTLCGARPRGLAPQDPHIDLNVVRSGHNEVNPTRRTEVSTAAEATGSTAGSDGGHAATNTASSTVAASPNQTTGTVESGTTARPSNITTDQTKTIQQGSPGSTSSGQTSSSTATPPSEQPTSSGSTGHRSTPSTHVSGSSTEQGRSTTAAVPSQQPNSTTLPPGEPTTTSTEPENSTAVAQSSTTASGGTSSSTQSTSPGEDSASNTTTAETTPPLESSSTSVTTGGTSSQAPSTSTSSPGSANATMNTTEGGAATAAVQSTTAQSTAVRDSNVSSTVPTEQPSTTVSTDAPPSPTSTTSRQSTTSSSGGNESTTAATITGQRNVVYRVDFSQFGLGENAAVDTGDGQTELVGEKAFCPSSFTLVDGAEGSGCYAVVEQPLDWWAAEHACRDLDPDAHLVAINSGEEQEAVNAVASLLDYAQCSTFWTCGQRVTVDASQLSVPFVWKLNGDDRWQTLYDFANWTPGGPDVSAGSCIHVASSAWSDAEEDAPAAATEAGGYWTISECGVPRCVVCEIEI